MSPEQINTAATMLMQPTGAVDSPRSSDVESESKDSEGEPDNMTNSDDVMQSSVESSEGSDSEQELTKAEALAALRKAKGKMDDIGSSYAQSSLKEQQNGEC